MGATKDLSLSERFCNDSLLLLLGDALLPPHHSISSSTHRSILDSYNRGRLSSSLLEVTRSAAYECEGEDHLRLGRASVAFANFRGLCRAHLNLPWSSSSL